MPWWTTGPDQSLFFTAGLTDEYREGGTLIGRVLASREAFAEAMHTQRLDGGVVSHWRLSDSITLDGRLSVTSTNLDRIFGNERIGSTQSTVYGEEALSGTARDNAWVLGLAFQHDGLSAAAVQGVGDGARAVVAGGGEAGVAAAPDVGLGADLVGRGDHGFDPGRGAGGRDQFARDQQLRFRGRRADVHFGGGETEVLLDLPPGEHTLQLVLSDADHFSFNPPLISKRITITVKGDDDGDDNKRSRHRSYHRIHWTRFANVRKDHQNDKHDGCSYRDLLGLFKGCQQSASTSAKPPAE